MTKYGIDYEGRSEDECRVIFSIPSGIPEGRKTDIERLLLDTQVRLSKIVGTPALNET